MTNDDETVDLSNFECRKCGDCCRWSGSVLLTEEDLDPLADFLGISCNEFLEKYTEVAPNRRSLRLIDPPDMTCIFLKEGRCIAYEARPQQCRDFPHKWRVSSGCPGLDALKHDSE
jgi:Fe-S-cluster containining protein